MKTEPTVGRLMEIKKTTMPGCFRISPARSADHRGSFAKIYHEQEFRALGLETDFREEYYTTSKRNVLRGLHFQIPPMQHAKLVICLDGSAADVVLDLRRGSPTYGKFEIFDLRSEQGQMIYIPAGFAHGFCVTSASALMLYKVTTVYDASCDKGILWSSAGIPWPSENPILSSRDSGFCAFEEFVSPFSYA